MHNTVSASESIKRCSLILLLCTSLVKHLHVWRIKFRGQWTSWAPSDPFLLKPFGKTRQIIPPAPFYPEYFITTYAVDLYHWSNRWSVSFHEILHLLIPFLLLTATYTQLS